MKKLLKVISLALVAMMLVACSGGKGGNEGGNESAGPAEVMIWHTLTDHDEEMLQQIVDAFNAEHEGEYHVTQETQPLDGFNAKVYEAVTNGVGPNLVWLFPSTAQDYIDAGLALDYSKYFTDADYKDRVAPGVYAASTDYADGGLHAAVCTLTGPIMFYNKELLEKYNLEVPQTWDDLYNACKTVVDGEKAEGKTIMGFGPDDDVTLSVIVMEQLGLSYIADDNTVPNWTNEKFINWLNWWKEAEDGGYFMLKDPEGYHSGPFGNQQYFSYMGSSAGMNYITPNGFTIVTGPTPQVAGGKTYTEITTRAMVGFTKDEAQDAGAAEFVKFFTKAENNLPFCQKYSASTPFSDVAESADYKAYFDASIAQQAFTELLSVSGTRKSVKGSGSADQALKAAVEGIIIDGADPAEALATAQATANAALAD
ncbi:MAG: extracellular solute-binding protein [Erysipelotrichaceae bacterium]|nr:extracellular solute-binding protein [Erysipelotrichaceae bacterium]